MAKGRGISRIVELVFDRASAQRMQREAQEALDKSTDPKKAQRNLSAAERAIQQVQQRIKTMAIEVGAALVAAFSIGVIKRFAEESIRAFTEAEAVWNRLAGTLRNAGVEFAAVQGDLQRRAAEFQRTTPFDDEAFASTLQTLVNMTGDYDRSLRAVITVANLAVGRQMDLASAAELVGKAMNGQTGALARNGIQIRAGEDAVAAIQAKMGDAAANELNSFAGKIQQINGYWGNFKEEIGGAIVSMVQSSSVLDDISANLDGATARIHSNRAAMVAWGTFLIVTVKAIGTSIMAPIRALWLLRGSFVDALSEMFNLLVAGAARVAIAVVDRLNLVSDQIKALSFGLVDVGQIDTSPLLRAQNAALDRANQYGQHLVNRIRTDGMAILSDLGNAYRDVGGTFIDAINGGVPEIDAIDDAALAAQDAETRRRRRRNRNNTTGTGNGNGSPRLPNRGVDTTPAGLAGGSGVTGDNAADFLLTVQQEQFQKVVDGWRAAHEEMERTTQDFAAGVADAWTDAFALILSGAGSIGDAMKLLAGEVAQSALGGLGQYASAKIGENIAIAFEERAKAVAALANPLTAATAPQHFAASAAAQAAAAKWTLYKALAGAGAGVAGGIGGVGGGGGYSGRDAGHGTARDAQMRGQEIHIYVDGVNPGNATHQDLIGAAMRGVVQRHGDDWANARITVHPRRG